MNSLTQQTNQSPSRTPSIDGIYPLSPMQQGMLFHTLLAPDSGAYIVQISYEIHGSLDIETFTKAWQQLLARHSILRSAFVWQNLEQPVQVIGKKVTCPIQVLDWRSVSASQQQIDLTEFNIHKRCQGFTLSKAPLMQITLIRMENDRFKFVWHYHHLLLDGWSMPILLQEFLALYQGRLLPPETPYKTYIAWLQQQSQPKAEAFWRDRLKGFEQPTQILTNYAISSDSKHYEELTNTLNPVTTQALQSFAKSHKVTLNAMLQSAWGLLISHYSAESDVLFGIVSSGRPLEIPGIDRMVGLLINTLPFRLAIDLNSDIPHYLQQVQSQLLEIRSYEYCSLVQIQSWSEVPRSLPLFESIVVFENYPIAQDWKDSLGDGIFISNVQGQEQTNYPLTLYVVAEESLSLRLLYDTDRFTIQSIQRILQHLQHILESMLQADRLSDIHLLTSNEQQQFVQWNETQFDRSELATHQLFEQQVLKSPDSIALYYSSTELTYSALNQQANQLAHQLILQGVQPGDRIGICLPRSAMLIVSLLAVMKAGAIYIPLDPTLPETRLQFMIQDAQLSLLICDRTVDRSDDVVQYLADEILDLTTCKNNLDLPILPDQIAYLIYTSGSTGQPKGVQISCSNLSNCLQSFQQEIELKPSDRTLATTTIGFDIAGLELFLPLISGAPIVLLENARNPETVIQAIEEFDIQFFQATPATWQLLLAAGWQGKSDLKVLCGGEAIDLPLATSLNAKCASLWNVYGPTETTIWSTTQLISKDVITKAIQNQTPIPIGKPIANSQLYILNSNFTPVPIGVLGELYIGGDGVMAGYWQRSDLNEIKLKTLDGNIIYATGDRASWREDGTVEYRGRWDDQVKLRGYRIELGEINACLLQHPQIEQALTTIVGVGEDARLVAYYTTPQSSIPKETPKPPELEVRDRSPEIDSIGLNLAAFLAEKLPNYMIPSQFIQLTHLPLTPSGKVDRRALPKVNEIDRPIVAPTTQLEQSIAQIWQTLLKIDSVSLEDNFFDIGGHSLLVIRIQGLLKTQLSVEISLIDLFRYPTIRSIVQHLEKQDGTDENILTQEVVDRGIARQAGANRLTQRRQSQRLSSQSGGLTK